jgi:ABC-type phosphate transport system substrate-binding protein
METSNEFHENDRRCRPGRRIDVGVRRRHHRSGRDVPFPIYSKWADAYKKETGNGLNYQSIGSGAGIKQIEAKTVTFGATDMPLKVEQLEKDGLVQWPMVMGAIVPVVNLEGVKPANMVFDGDTLAKHLSRQDHQMG